MTEKGKSEKEVTGRSVWDFSTEISRKLGIFIIVLVGVLYGIYKYQEQARLFEESRQNATKNIQEQLNTANESLRDTYVAIGTMNETMIENIQKAFGTLQLLQDRIARLQRESEAATETAAKAVAEKLEAGEQRAKALAQLQEIEAEQERLQKLRVARSGPFKDDVTKLVTLMRSDRSISNDNILTLASDIHEKYLIDPVTLFDMVSKDTSIRNLKELEQLEGMSVETLTRIAKENQSNFSTWMLMEAEGIAMLGIVKAYETKFKGGILFEINEGRIYKSDNIYKGSFISFPSLSNWDDQVIGMMVEDLEGELEFDEIPATFFHTHPRDKIRLSEWFSFEEDIKRTLLSREEVTFRPISIEKLQKTEPSTYEKIFSIGDLKVIMRTLTWAKTYDANSIVPVTLGESYGNIGTLRDTIVQTLNAAVRRDQSKRNSLAEKEFISSNWGYIGAAALGDNLTIKQFSLSQDRLGASFIFDYIDLMKNADYESNLVLKRANSSPKAKWRLAAYSSKPQAIR